MSIIVAPHKSKVIYCVPVICTCKLSMLSCSSTRGLGHRLRALLHDGEGPGPYFHLCHQVLHPCLSMIRGDNEWCMHKSS